MGSAISKTVMSCTIRPLWASTHTAKSCLPSSVAEVIQIWSPQTTGDDQALPWTAVFQETPLVSSHSTGSNLDRAWPSPPGPRNWLHDSAPGSELAIGSTTTRSVSRQVLIQRVLRNRSDHRSITAPAGPWYHSTGSGQHSQDLFFSISWVRRTSIS